MNFRWTPTTLTILTTFKISISFLPAHLPTTHPLITVPATQHHTTTHHTLFIPNFHSTVTTTALPLLCSQAVLLRILHTIQQNTIIQAVQPHCSCSTIPITCRPTILNRCSPKSTATIHRRRRAMAETMPISRARGRHLSLRTTHISSSSNHNSITFHPHRACSHDT